MRFAVLGGMLATAGWLALAACVSHTQFPDSTRTGKVYEIKLGESLTPAVLTMKRGDEVRWVNASTGPMEVAIVQTREELLSCQRGFASTNLGYLFGTSEYENILLAAVRPDESASLCFAIAGTYVYSVRDAPSKTAGGKKATGSIKIE